MNKNPFEIRTELLKLSKEILINASHSQIQRDDKGNPLPIDNPPTVDDVIDNAKKLNKFVSGN